MDAIRQIEEKLKSNDLANRRLRRRIKTIANRLLKLAEEKKEEPKDVSNDNPL